LLSFVSLKHSSVCNWCDK